MFYYFKSRIQEHTVSAVIIGAIIRYELQFYGDLLIIFSPNINRSIIEHWTINVYYDILTSIDSKI